ncbi:MAG: class I SAM-dependent methyltransferase [Nanoarchaeota archaeon]
MKSIIQKQEHRNESVFNFVAGQYDKGFIGKWLFDVVKATVNEISLKRNSRILDAGTGTGNLLFILEKKNKDLQLYGIDVSNKMLAHARRKLKHAHLMRLSVSDVEKKFKNNFFDYIFVVDAFHHFPEHVSTVHTFYRVLKNNGMLIITDFDFGSLFNYIFHMLEPGNSGIYTKKAMQKLFIQSGFKIKKQKRLGLFSVMTVGIKMPVRRNI